MHPHALVYAAHPRQTDVDVGSRIDRHAVHGRGLPAGMRRAIAFVHADRMFVANACSRKLKLPVASRAMSSGPSVPLHMPM